MIEPDDAKPDVDVSSLRSGSRRRAIIFSIMFHVVLFGGLLCWYVPQKAPSSAKRGANATATIGQPQVPLKLGADVPATLGDHVPSTQIEASLDAALKQAEHLSDERMLSELEKKLKRLHSVSSVEAVQDTTGKIASTLGLSSGPVPASGRVEGTFDTRTAQIHEMTRSRGENGDWVYHSVLVDSAGRTESIVLPKTEGEVTYKTFQQLKRFPMADGIYRQLVMPMLQNMLDAKELAEAQSRELRRQEMQNEFESKKQHGQDLGPAVQRRPTKSDKGSRAP